MLHWVEAVGEKRPLGETELAWAAGPETRKYTQAQQQQQQQ